MANGRGSRQVPIGGWVTPGPNVPNNQSATAKITGPVLTRTAWYSGSGVQFPASSSLYVSPTTISNCTQISISMWVNLTSANNSGRYVPLLTFGTNMNIGGNGVFAFASVVSIVPSGNLNFDFFSGVISSGSDTVFGEVNCGASSPLPFDSWHHLFISVDVSSSFANGAFVPTNIFLDGVQIASSPTQVNQNSSLGGVVVPIGSRNSFLVNGLSIGVPRSTESGLDQAPSGTNNGGMSFSDVQIWFGTYIDPLGSYQGGNVVKANAPNPELMQEVVNAAIGAGVSPMYVLTAMDIESTFGTQKPSVYITAQDNSSNVGIFQEAQDDAIYAFGGTAGNYPLPSMSANDLSTKIFLAQSINPVGGASYQDVALTDVGADPTGMFSYLGQMGAGFGHGQDVILTNWVATPTLPISALGTIKGSIGYNMLHQDWSQNGPYGLQKLKGSNTLNDYINNLTTYWTNKQSYVASFLGGTAQNITAFRSALGFPVPLAVAANVFGKPTLLFYGNAASFPSNRGLSADNFSLINGPLTDVSGPP